MTNLIDYMAWRGDVPFSIAPFNPVDNLVLSEFSYMSLDSIKYDTLANAALALIANGRAQGNGQRLMELVAASPRIGGARILNFTECFDPEREMQFAAEIIELDDGTACIVFRGTDATLVGWKEDLNMSFAAEVPSQAAAIDYLNKCVKYTSLPLRVMGHSKGGNLAVYSSALCNKEIQDRIIAVYNDDGPGLNEIAMASEGYARIESRVQTFLPQSSVVGMLLNHPENYQVIHADATRGILQHDPYTWETTRDNFSCEGELRRGSLYADKTIKDWVKGIPPIQRQEFIDTVYVMLQSTHARTMYEVAALWKRNPVSLISAMSKLEPEARRHMHTVIGALLSAGAKNILMDFPGDAQTPDDIQNA